MVDVRVDVLLPHTAQDNQGQVHQLDKLNTNS